MMFILTGLLLSLALACQPPRYIEPDLQLRPGPPVFFADPYVERSIAPIYVMPQTAPEKVPGGLVFAPEVDTDLKGKQRVGRELGRVFFRTWQGQGVLRSLQYAEDTPWPGKERAMEQAGRRDAELVIRPTITHVLLGGSQGTTSLALEVAIFDASTEELLWSMEHSGRMENAPDEDFIVFTRKTRMPASPEYVVMYSLAFDLAKPVRQWARGLDWRKDLAPLDRSY